MGEQVRVRWEIRQRNGPLKAESTNRNLSTESRRPAGAAPTASGAARRSVSTGRTDDVVDKIEEEVRELRESQTTPNARKKK